MEIGDIIACNLKRLREERHLSLSQLANLAGVSKVMLSQLEKGGSNPTVNTIWKIAGALRLPYSSLLELPDQNVIHIKKENLQELEEDGYHIFNYYPRDAERSFELYQVEMDCGCVHRSVGHSVDSTEYIIVTAGQLELEVNAEHYCLHTGDGLCFEAAAPHLYRQLGEERTTLTMMVFYR